MLATPFSHPLFQPALCAGYTLHPRVSLPTLTKMVARLSSLRTRVSVEGDLSHTTARLYYHPRSRKGTVIVFRVLNGCQINSQDSNMGSAGY